MTIRTLLAAAAAVSALCSAAVSQDPPPVGAKALSRPSQEVRGKPGKDKSAPAKQELLRGLGYVGVPAKPPTQEELRKRRDAKLAGAWVKNAAWISDYDQAREVAKAKDQKIFAYFTRSDFS